MPLWTDRQGRFAPLKALTLAAALAPGLWLAFALATARLGPKPIEVALHETGLWSVRFLLLALAVTPLRRASGWNRLLQIRRMLGVTAFAYVAIHLGLYLFDQNLDLVKVASEILRRFYLTIGFVALAAMAALAATSTDAAVRRLGAERWGRLHRLVFPIAILALWHTALQEKLDVFDATWMSGVLVALLLARSPMLGVQVPGWRWWLVPLVTLAATAAIELVWYAAATKVPVARVWEANFVAGLQPRPALVAALVALLLPLARAARPLLSAGEGRKTAGARNRRAVT